MRESGNGSVALQVASPVRSMASTESLQRYAAGVSAARNNAEGGAYSVQVSGEELRSGKYEAD